jgi:hypothetical protein
MRYMAFSLTQPQMRARTKDVTRRLGWRDLKPEQLLCAIEKGQGLRKGESVVPICSIQVADVRLEPLERMIDEPVYGFEECRREGFPELSPQQFVAAFCRSHRRCRPSTEITRIEFVFLDAQGRKIL